MNLLHKPVLILLIIYLCSCVNSSNSYDKTKLNDNNEYINQENSSGVEDTLIINNESLNDFLVRTKIAANSEDDNALKKIIIFPLRGYADTYDKAYKTFEDLKSDERIYYFFKENIPFCEIIESDKEISLEVGDDCEANKWYSFRYLGDSYNYFKLDKIEGKYVIIGVYIPGF